MFQLFFVIEKTKVHHNIIKNASSYHLGKKNSYFDSLRVKMQKIYFVLFSVVICSPWYQNFGNGWDDQMIDRSIHEKKVNNINKKGIWIQISNVL